MEPIAVEVERGKWPARIVCGIFRHAISNLKCSRCGERWEYRSLAELQAEHNRALSKLVDNMQGGA